MPAGHFRVIFCFFLLSVISSNTFAQNARRVLLKNIDSIPMPAVPDRVSIFYTINERPEIIATAGFNIGAKLWATAIMASTMQKGKVFALGSSVYLREEMLKDKAVRQLLKNTLQWAGNGKKNIRVAVNKEADNPGLLAYLTAQKAKPYVTANFNLKKGTDVLILTTDVSNPAQLQQIEKFIVNGGTLLFASPYAGQYPRHDKNQEGIITRLGLEQLLAKAGIYNPNITILQTPKSKMLNKDSIPDYLHINTMLPGLLIPEYTNQSTQLINLYMTSPVVELVLKFNGPQSPVMKTLKQYFGVPDSLPTPSPARPWLINTPKLKMAARLAYKLYEQPRLLTGMETKAAGYKIFPGEVRATAPRVNENVTIPVKVGLQGLVEPQSVYYRPHSTGLYVAAGEKVIITLSPEMVKQTLKAQIGIHKDELFDVDQITRAAPNLTRTFYLDKETNVVFSPYGGLLLINIADTCTLKNITIQVKGAVKAPYFKLGETSEADWNTTIRDNPGPWAELATDNIILTVPSYRIRKLSNPVKLMQLWDEVLNADADLAIISRKRVYQERIIIDSDISSPGAYMFCDYDRIIAPDDNSAALMLDEARLRAKGSWGHFHELGHRHQFSAIDFPGTGEVTVNLYTTYVYDKVLHKGLYNHDDIPNKEATIKKVKGFLNNNPTYEKWKQDPFLALSMYIQIIDAFGWDVITAAHTIYRNMPKDQYPHTDQQKRDLWFTTISKTTNSNLTRFFEVWKIPVSDDAKKQVEGYKVWFPKELE